MKKVYAYIVQLLCCCGLLVWIGCLLSCKKFVTIDPPQNQVVTATVFKDEQSATAAVTGLYSQMTATNLQVSNGSLSVYAGLSADELYRTTANADIDAFTANALTETNAINAGLWSKCYQFIYHANACIEGLINSDVLSIAVKQQLVAEMKLARALCYYWLLNLYTNVPLVTTTDYTTNAVAGQSSSSEVYDQVIMDLTDARALLPVAYPTTGRVRPNKWTAAALLARVYLYQQDWVHAEEEATAVISSGSYNIVTPVNDVFLATSAETIWQLIPVSSSSNTAEGATFIPSSATTRPTYALTNNLLSSFETGDLRKANWIKTNTVSGQPYAYPFKYKVRSSATKTEYNIVLRLAELYLIRAEARAQQNKITECKTDLNTIRSRAGLSPTTASDKPTLLLAIEKEKRNELFAEWGHRWFDLQRTNRATAVLAPLKAGWLETAIHYPIPLPELQRNPFLMQNPGY